MTCPRCSMAPIFAAQRCRACYEYRRRHHEERPEYLMLRTATRRYLAWCRQQEESRMVDVLVCRSYIRVSVEGGVTSG